MAQENIRHAQSYLGDNIKIDLGNYSFGMWSEDRWRALVRTVIKLWIC
jgi:hypothetical protein